MSGTYGPTVRITLEHMKTEIISHFMKYSEDLNEKVAYAIKSGIDNFNFDAEVSEIVDEVLKAAIKDYFRFGEGKQIISDAVNDTFKSAVNKKGDKQ